MHTIKASLVTAVAVATMGAAHAAPVTYRFSTSPLAFGGSLGGPGPFPTPSLFNGGISGTFVYDSSALFVQNNPDGSATYRGFTPQSVTGFASSLSNLSGTVAGHAFSDLSGSTQVGNDTFVSGGVGGDIYQFLFDPGLGSPSPANFSGFNITDPDPSHGGTFTLYRIRMFWIEGQSVPGTIPDFLGNQNLLAAPPGFNGRVGLDFYKTGNPSQQAVVFFDNLQVHAMAPIPEPETYAMLLAGLGMLGAIWTRRRRAVSA